MAGHKRIVPNQLNHYSILVPYVMNNLKWFDFYGMANCLLSWHRENGRMQPCFGRSAVLRGQTEASGQGANYAARRPTTPAEEVTLGWNYFRVADDTSGTSSISNHHCFRWA